MQLGRERIKGTPSSDIFVIPTRGSDLVFHHLTTPHQTQNIHLPPAVPSPPLPSARVFIAVVPRETPVAVSRLTSPPPPNGPHSSHPTIESTLPPPPEPTNQTLTTPPPPHPCATLSPVTNDENSAACLLCLPHLADHLEPRVRPHRLGGVPQGGLRVGQGTPAGRGDLLGALHFARDRR